jgi:hypothetical protein
MPDFLSLPPELLSMIFELALEDCEIDLKDPATNSIDSETDLGESETDFANSESDANNYDDAGGWVTLDRDCTAFLPPNFEFIPTSRSWLLVDGMCSREMSDAIGRKQRQGFPSYEFKYTACVKWELREKPDAFSRLFTGIIWSITPYREPERVTELVLDSVKIPYFSFDLDTLHFRVTVETEIQPVDEEQCEFVTHGLVMLVQRFLESGPGLVGYRQKDREFNIRELQIIWEMKAPVDNEDELRYLFEEALESELEELVEKGVAVNSSLINVNEVEEDETPEDDDDQESETADEVD